jgi:hypothetical protein
LRAWIEPLKLGILGKLGEFLVELIDSACRIDEFHLAGKEGVGFGRNFQADQGIFIAVLPGNGFLGGGAGFGQESLVAGKILEHNETVVGWMEIFFHNRV